MSAERQQAYRARQAARGLIHFSHANVPKELHVHIHDWINKLCRRHATGKKLPAAITKGAYYTLIYCDTHGQWYRDISSYSRDVVVLEARTNFPDSSTKIIETASDDESVVQAACEKMIAKLAATSKE